MDNVTLIPLGTLPTLGEITAFPETAIPIGVTSITVRIDRTRLLDAGISISLDLELSVDGGISWAYLAGAGLVGGVVSNPKTLLPHTESSLTVGNLPQPSNPNRLLRGILKNNLPAITSIILSMS